MKRLIIIVTCLLLFLAYTKPAKAQYVYYYPVQYYYQPVYYYYPVQYYYYPVQYYYYPYRPIYVLY